MNENVRELVVNTLLELEEEGRKSHLLIRDVLDKFDYMDAKDKAFYKRLTEGTISDRITLDYVIDRYSKKPVSKLKPVVRAILRMSAYQILFMEKVPDSAACDEAVKLVKKLSRPEFAGFVNGILRNISKEKEKALDFSDIKEKSAYLSVRYSCPEWIVKMFLKEQKNTEAILEGMSAVRPTCVHVLRHVDDYQEKWRQAGITVTPGCIVKDSFYLENFEGLESVPGFLEGDILVQDESSSVSSLATGTLGKSVKVLDVCAAPGGKSCFTASKLGDKGSVTSCDVSEQKVALITENAQRLGLDIEAVVQDATEFVKEWEEAFDVIICDVPCSGLGVMGRKSDIKYNITNEGMKDICELQKSIVLNVCRYLKKGGVFVYSTCTIHKAENEKMVKYIEENLSLRGDSLKPFVPVLFTKERPSENYVQLLPGIDGTDGFFVARFIKE